MTKSKVIFEELNKLGIPTNLSGRGYIEDALDLMLADSEYFSNVSGKLYPEIAEQNNATAKNISQAIRNAIENAVARSSANTWGEYFGSTLARTKVKPTNSEFLTMVARRIALEEANNVHNQN